MHSVSKLKVKRDVYADISSFSTCLVLMSRSYACQKYTFPLSFSEIGYTFFFPFQFLAFLSGKFTFKLTSPR